MCLSFTSFHKDLSSTHYYVPAAVSGAGDPVVNKKSQPSCSYCSRGENTSILVGGGAAAPLSSQSTRASSSVTTTVKNCPGAHSYSRWMSTIQLSLSNDALCHPGKYLQHPVLTLQWIMGKLQKDSTTSSITMQEQFHFTDLSLPTIYLTLFQALGLQTEKPLYLLKLLSLVRETEK